MFSVPSKNFHYCYSALILVSYDIFLSRTTLVLAPFSVVTSNVTDEMGVISFLKKIQNRADTSAIGGRMQTNNGIFGFVLELSKTSKKSFLISVVNTMICVGCSGATGSEVATKHRREKNVEKRDRCESTKKSDLNLTNQDDDALDLTKKHTKRDSSKKVLKNGRSSECDAKENDVSNGSGTAKSNSGPAKPSTSPSPLPLTPKSGSGQGSRTDSPPSPAPSNDLRLGQRLYEANCTGARCHSTSGSDVNGRTPEAIATAIERRRPMRGVRVTAEEIKLISFWLMEN